MELHCSQTFVFVYLCIGVFETPMELHCSQTYRLKRGLGLSLRPLWNYTALKLMVLSFLHLICLRPLWNYTALKRSLKLEPPDICLRPLWNYTALKHTRHNESCRQV